MTLEIRLDPQGEPHWLSGIRAVKRWLSRQRYALLFRYQVRRDTRAWLKRHGGVAKTEDMKPQQNRRSHAQTNGTSHAPDTYPHRFSRP